MTTIFLCLKIFFARILDVSISTVRTIYVLKGRTIIVAILAFLEVTIWFLVAREALNVEKMSFWIVLSYAGGYTTGTILGTFISKKFIKGNLGLEVISSKITNDDIHSIKDEGFGVSSLEMNEGKIMLILQINKKRLEECKSLIYSLDKDAFITVHETKYVYNGFF